MLDFKKFGIKNLAEEDRPREKALQKGLSALSNSELIAILLGSGSEQESAVELAQKIMNEYNNNLNLLGKATVEELKNKFHGVGYAKAVTIAAAMELGRRRELQEMPEMPVIKTSYDIVKLFKPILCDLKHEEFWIALLKRNNRVIARFNVSKGGISGTCADVRVILKKALENGSSSIVLCHNHPSGNLNPSNEDIELTKKLKDAGKLMNIPIVDHVIISDNNFFSFSDENIL